MPVRTVSVNKRDRGWPCGQFSVGKALNTAGVRLTLAALGAPHGS